MRTALEYDGGPFAIRYPRAAVPDAADALSAEPRGLTIGEWEVLRAGQAGTILAVGTMVEVALDASDRLASAGFEMGVIDARFIKPLDLELLSRVAERGNLIVTLEENSLLGGFGSLVAGALVGMKWPGSKERQLIRLGLPDRFIEHGSRPALLESVGLTPARVAHRIAQVAGGERSGRSVSPAAALRRS